MKEKHYKTLLRWHYVLTCLGALSIVLFLAFYLHSHRQQFFERQQDRLRVESAVAAAQTQNLLNTIVVSMEMLDAWMRLHPGVDPRFNLEFLDLVNTFRRYNQGKLDLRLVSDRGGLYYLPAKDTVPLAWVGDREYFKAQIGMPRHHLHFAAPVKSRVTGKWGLPISFRLSPNPHGLAILFVALEFPYCDSLFKNLLKDSLKSVSIVRSDTLVLIRSPFDSALVGKRYHLAELEPGLLYREFSFIPEGYRKRVLAYSPIEGMPLAVIVAYSYTRLQEMWWEEGYKRLLFGIIVLLVFLVLNGRLAMLMRNLNRVKLELENAARFDSLTSLCNRRYFLERAREEMERSQRSGKPVVLLLADIDYFKRVNDTYGHPMGDKVLQAVAASLKEGTRATDVTGRVGGEEFAVALSETSLDTGLEVAERIRSLVAGIQHEEWQGGLSLGVAQWKGAGESLEELYQRADDALYRAKKQGRNRVVSS